MPIYNYISSKGLGKVGNYNGKKQNVVLGTWAETAAGADADAFAGPCGGDDGEGGR